MPAAATITADGLLDNDRLVARFVELQRPVAEAIAAGRDIGSAGDALHLEAQATIAAEIGARVRHGVRTEHPFLERLVLFWASHFAVDQTTSGPMKFLSGSFEREAIRPHVLGRFADMLVAATTHPAMLVYLDSAANIGPNSPLGRRLGVERLNENHARELFELHTLGIGGGYTQADVLAAAGTLSGWTGRVAQRPPPFEALHEPGPRTILGERVPDSGQDELPALLRRLAVHPATARHLARKLARHFVGDDVSAELVAALAATFRETDGDLAAVARVLLGSDEAWRAPARKTVPPYDFMIGTARALGLGGDALPVPFVVRALRAMGQETWAPPSPAGWPDDDDAFLGGDALLERLDVVRALVARSGTREDPATFAHRLFADGLGPHLNETLARAADPVEGLSLVLMASPLVRR